jgi:hypothetical protein
VITVDDVLEELEQLHQHVPDWLEAETAYAGCVDELEEILFKIAEFNVRENRLCQTPPTGRPMGVIVGASSTPSLER